MFHEDFRLHIMAINSLIKDLSKNRDGCIENLDLLLCWLTIRFLNANTSVIMRAMEYLSQVFQELQVFYKYSSKYKYSK